MWPLHGRYMAPFLKWRVFELQQGSDRAWEPPWQGSRSLRGQDLGEGESLAESSAESLAESSAVTVPWTMQSGEPGLGGRQAAQAVSNGLGLFWRGATVTVTGRETLRQAL